ncbi:MAG: hypothetical protein M1381_08385 [Deltaproteobacteria bacterium]|nr:hypothetical protein [Deltaproteobacteria bacterium]MCL5792328.1 hypothetical protein [Deltaproteobacteria bacterium]
MAEYEQRIKELPALGDSSGGRSYRARKGRHIVTFHATQNTSSSQKAMWFKDGNSLDDILALWSFAGGLEVGTSPTKMHCPVANECTYELEDSISIAKFVTDAYGKIRHRPVNRRIKSALLTYLEVRHVRPLQLKVALLTSVLECLAPRISTDYSNKIIKRYKPINDLFFELVAVWNIDVPYNQIELLVVELFRFRNKFLHSGVFPYREKIKIGKTTTNIGRVAIASRMLTKLTIQKELKFSMNSSGSIALASNIREFFRSGSFVPPVFSYERTT